MSVLEGSAVHWTVLQSLTHSHTYRTFRGTNEHILHVCGLRQEAGERRENPCRLENMQVPSRKGLGGFEAQTFSCEGT